MDCVCGFNSPKSGIVSGHKVKCDQWHEYLKQLSSEPEVKEKSIKLGMLETSKFYKISPTTLRKCLGLSVDTDHNKPSKAVKGNVDTIMDAIEKMGFRNVQLEEDNKRLKVELSNTKSEIARILQSRQREISIKLQSEQLELRS